MSNIEAARKPNGDPFMWVPARSGSRNLILMREPDYFRSSVAIGRPQVAPTGFFRHRFYNNRI
jgi:hypothetical protein